ncbi:MAG: hypothetical protein WKG07_07740 [Hymenobacter sp.]
MGLHGHLGAAADGAARGAGVLAHAAGEHGAGGAAAGAACRLARGRRPRR